MDASQFSANVRPQSAIVLVDLHGDINGDAEHALNQAVADAMLPGAAPVLLNFSDVRYINSTGIALIVGVLARARREQREIVACGLSEHYEEIFRITRLADFMRMYPDEASAVQGQAAA
jgi:anti-sigma B factor antagonist